jgi:Rrf2 family nitric oxide-sensitive transcriptional repressor
MQLTLHTDYSLRVLVYLAQKTDGLATISEISKFYQISRNHLVKVVHHLAHHHFIQTTRGKYGGIRLARAPELISVGEVVRRMEPSFDIVECFNSTNRPCVVSPVCALKEILYKASIEFLGILDRYTLADAIVKNAQTEQIFSLEQLIRR